MGSDRATSDLDGILNSGVDLPQHVVHRAFATEMVVLNLNTGRYHGLNPTAGRMLEVLAEESTVQVAANRLAREFDVPAGQVEADIVTFCRDLLERGLIALQSEPDAA